MSVLTVTEKSFLIENDGLSKPQASTLSSTIFLAKAIYNVTDNVLSTFVLPIAVRGLLASLLGFFSSINDFTSLLNILLRTLFIAICACFLIEKDVRSKSKKTVRFVEPNKSSILSSILYHAKTVRIISDDVLSTFVLPVVVFGILAALSGSYLSTNDSPRLPTILLRTPLVAFWVWINIMCFQMSNQHLADAIIEDKLNKPWRAIPAGRLTSVQMRRCLLASLPFVAGISYYLGVGQEIAISFALNWIYNDLKAADDSCITRNLVVALAFAVYNHGAFRIALGPAFAPNSTAFVWTLLISATIFITMHVSDFRDAKGDKERGRNTIPILLGGDAARLTVAVPMVGLSVFFPRFTGVSLAGYFVPLAMGLLVALRLLLVRTPKADKKTYKIWSLWLASVLFLPAIAHPGAFVQYRPF